MPPPRREMHLGAFLFNYGNHIAGWRHPATPPGGLLDLDFYKRLALAAERGKFDFVFHSDGVGINDTYPAIIAHAVTIRPEPISLLSALAAVTSGSGSRRRSRPRTTSPTRSPASSPRSTT